MGNATVEHNNKNRTDREIDVDSRWEILEELRHFLEWQKLCGTDVWLVEDEDAWKPEKFKASNITEISEISGISGISGISDTASSSSHHFSQTSQDRRKQKSSSNQHEQSRYLPPQVIKEKSIEETAKVHTKPDEDLSGKWGLMLEKRPPKIDPTILDEQNGIKNIKNHQQKYCKAKNPCVLGGGRPRNPVLILEGHPEGLSTKGRETLSIIRSKVLNLQQNQIYWLPYPMNVGNNVGNIEKTKDKGCGLCANLFSATLECISPKVVLVMGTDLKHRVPMSPAENSSDLELVLGSEIQLITSKGSIPGIWTFHPNDLADAPFDIKQASMRHLSLFSRLMRQKNIS